MRSGSSGASSATSAWRSSSPPRSRSATGSPPGRSSPRARSRSQPAGCSSPRTGGRQRIGVREGFLVISLTWLLVPAFGSLPYHFADEAQLANPIDAYFEAVSGFTATGATVLVDVEALDRSLLLWRQLTQWLGGMGIVVLAIAVLPKLRVGGRQLLQSELAGPTELRATRGHDPRDGPAPLGALRRPDHRDGARARRDRLERSRRRHGCLRRDLARVHGNRDRRLLDPQRLAGRLRPRGAVGRGRLPRGRRRQLPAAVPAVRAAPTPGASRGTRNSASTSASSRSARCCSSSSWSAAASSARRGRCATPSSRRSRS